jgi:hypothetical protein
MQNEIAVKLQGGLGNQLFQYAAGFALAKKLNCNLILDARFIGLGANRIYQLSNLKISGKLADFPNLNYFPLESSEKRKINLASNPRQSFKHVQEPYFHYWDGFNSLKKRTYLDGYWQSAKYFEESSESLLNEFKLKRDPGKLFNAILTKLSSSKSVGIHIRRGDYATNKQTKKFHGLLNDAYFRTGMSELGIKTVNSNTYFFTDDPNWVAKNLGVEPKQIMSLMGFDDVEELMLFAATPQKILSNSSFSWWGAWLGKSEKVIAPRCWFPNNTNNETKDLYLKHWRLV